jgi:hypothetical protein
MFARSLSYLVLALLPLLCSQAHAQPARSSPIYFVGVQLGCERDGSLDRRIERRLHERGVSVHRLTQKDGDPLPSCFAGRCGVGLQKSCPGMSGRILGGQVQQGSDFTQVRLWLHDLSTGQTAFQDDYCQGCELIGAVATQATRLVGSSPAFGAAPTAAPTYCAPGATARPPTSAASGGAAGPLFLAVVGDHKHRASVQTAVKQQLQLLGKPVQAVEVKSLGQEILQKLVAAHPRSQVLGIELPKDGKVQVILYDQASAQNDGKLIECETCDKDTLVSRLKTEVSSLLDRCFGDACGNPAASATAAEVPPAACQPFPDPACGMTDGGTPSFPARHIDSHTATLVKGVLWGLTAVSTATAIGLAIANPLVVQERNGRRYGDTLSDPAWALGSVSVGLLVASIPLTLAVRNARASSSSPSAASSAQLVCPN